ncbi:MAG: prephenate dehydratase domain-containing protein, partial [Pseudomonadota bacterium]
MRISYLGPEGTFGEEAARAFRPDATLVPRPSIPAALDALVRGEVERAFLPFDNIKAGPVGETFDALYARREDVLICDMQVMRIRHAIGGFGAPGSVRLIRSRGNTLAQCSDYLARHYPNAMRESVASTSRAIADLAESRDPSVAAVGNPRAMDRYGVPILDRDIGDASDNTMRFVLLSRRADGFRVPTGRDMTSLVMDPPADRAGLLFEALTVVSGTHGLNLSALHSRPDGRGGLRFFADIEGHVDDTPVDECLADLNARLTHDRVALSVIGSYPRRPFVDNRIKTI